MPYVSLIVMHKSIRILEHNLAYAVDVTMQITVYMAS